MTPLIDAPGADYSQTPTVPIEVLCKCEDRPRRVPLRMTLDALKIFHLLFRKVKLNPGMVVQTWRCSKCKEIRPITVKQMHLLPVQKEV
jgi:hypothetical protein